MLACAWRQRWIVIPSTFFLYCLIEHIWTWNCGWLRANLLANSNIYQKNKERKGWKFYIITYMHGYLRNSGVDLYLSRTWSLTDINISAGCVCVCVQSCPTLCNPMDCNPPGFSVHGISQARILEWVAISYARESSQPRDQTCVSVPPALAGGSLPPGPTDCHCIDAVLLCLLIYL